MSSRTLIALLCLFSAFGLVVAEDAAPEEPSSESVASLENGDINGDGNRNITDIIVILNHLFVGGPEPVAAFCQFYDPVGDQTYNYPPRVRNGDVNGDGSMNIADAIALVSWLFGGGFEPVPIACDAVTS